MTERDRARLKARQTRLDSDWSSYKVLRNKCTKLQTQEKKQSENNIFEDIERKNDSKKLFFQNQENAKLEDRGPPHEIHGGGQAIPEGRWHC